MTTFGLRNRHALCVHGDMNDINNANIASITNAAASAAIASDVLSSAGGTLTSLLRTPCPCTQAAQRAGGFIGARRRSTFVALSQAQVAVTIAKGINWTGNAANRCRDALDACARTMIGIDDRLRETARLTCMGGPS